MDVAEPTMTCPYNKAHSIISSRMQFHLTKCRLQYPNAEKTVCPFNSTHIVNKVELAYHQLICNDRIVLDSFTCKVGTSATPRVQVAKVENIEIRGDECWDEPIPVSVLERVHETSKTKPTLQALIGAPKSERKAFRNQERLRIQRVLDNNASADRNKLEKNAKKKENPRNFKGEPVKAREGGDDKYPPHKSRSEPSHSGYQSEGDSDNHHVVQKSSADIPRDPRNPWFSKRAPSNSGYNSDGETYNLSEIKADELKHDVAAPLTKSLGNLKVQSGGSSTDRDRQSGNPWRISSAPLSPSADKEDFPLLPVTSRGRGKRKSSTMKIK